MSKPQPAKSLPVRLGAAAASIVTANAAIAKTTPREIAEWYVLTLNELLGGRTDLATVAESYALLVKQGRKAKK